jgi:hypothetical protein
LFTALKSTRRHIKNQARKLCGYFTQYGILDYIAECYGALHTTGPEYIIHDIDGFIEEKQRMGS